MAILIKGMEMPESCFSCNFAVDGCCLAMRPIRTRDWKAKETTNYCPLVEVPEPKAIIAKEDLERLTHQWLDWLKQEVEDD